MKIKYMLLCVLAISQLIACNSEQNTAVVLEPIEITPVTNDLGERQTGYFLDSAVHGVNYFSSDGTNGKTGVDGSFFYYYGDSIEFKIGGTTLGDLHVAALPNNTILLVGGPSLLVTPLTISPSAIDSDDQKVVNKLIFLQTMDADGDLDNGILITDEIHQAAKDITLDFSLPVDEFVSGELLALVSVLNEKKIFSDKLPRVIQSEIGALRHFGDLSTAQFDILNIPPTKITYNTWWLETGNCSDIGKSVMMIKNKSVTFCPNVRGQDGCYNGVIRASGILQLPEMVANNNCAQNPSLSGTTTCSGAEYYSIQANLKFVDNRVIGTFEASCNVANQNSIQTIEAAYIQTKVEGGTLTGAPLYSALDSIRDDIIGIVSSGSCSVDTDCGVLALKGNYTCSIPEYVAHSNNIDENNLLLKTHIYAELKDEIESSVGGTTWCVLAEEPTAICVSKTCQL